MGVLPLALQQTQYLRKEGHSDHSGISNYIHQREKLYNEGKKRSQK